VKFHSYEWYRKYKTPRHWRKTYATVQSPTRDEHWVTEHDTIPEPFLIHFDVENGRMEVRSTAKSALAKKRFVLDLSGYL